MKLETSYESMTAVPDGFQGAYTEQGGKAVLTGGDFEFKNEADVTAVQTAKGHVKTELADAMAKLNGFQGIDVDAYKANQEELDVLRAKAKDGGNDEETIKAIVDARVLRATEELNAKNGELTTQLEEATGFKLKTEKSSLLKSVLGENVSSAAMLDAEFIIGSAIERQADGTYMSNGSAGFDKGLTVEALVQKAVESRPHWKKQSTPGHGQGGNGGGDVAPNKRFNELIDKQKKRTISRAETKELATLANQIKTSQGG